MVELTQEEESIADLLGKAAADHINLGNLLRMQHINFYAVNDPNLCVEDLFKKAFPDKGEWGFCQCPKCGGGKWKMLGRVY